MSISADASFCSKFYVVYIWWIHYLNLIFHLEKATNNINLYFLSYIYLQRIQCKIKWIIQYYRWKNIITEPKIHLRTCAQLACQSTLFPTNQLPAQVQHFSQSQLRYNNRSNRVPRRIQLSVAMLMTSWVESWRNASWMQLWHHKDDVIKNSDTVVCLLTYEWSYYMYVCLCRWRHDGNSGVIV